MALRVCNYSRKNYSRADESRKRRKGTLKSHPSKLRLRCRQLRKRKSEIRNLIITSSSQCSSDPKWVLIVIEYCHGFVSQYAGDNFRCVAVIIGQLLKSYSTRSE